MWKAPITTYVMGPHTLTVCPERGGRRALWVRKQRLKLDGLGSNPSSHTFWLCDVGRLCNLSCVCFLNSKMGIVVPDALG